MNLEATLAAKTAALADLLDSIDPRHMPEPLDVVQALRMIRDTAESALPNAVDVARNSSSSWTDLGRALSTSRQAAWERYCH